MIPIDVSANSRRPSAMPSRVFAAVLSLALLVPVLGISLQDAAMLEQLHNRKLHPWPTTGEFVANPAQFFTRVRKWLGDRVYPVKEAVFAQKRLLFYALHTSPRRILTLGRGGHVFVNGLTDHDIFSLFERLCIAPHTRDHAQMLERALSAPAEYATRKRIQIDVVLVPTPNTIYGDYLPNSVPERYRKACAERAHGHSPLVDLERTAPLTYVFPMTEMQKLRDIDGFFPKANWHPIGLSVKVVRDAYLAKLGRPVVISETIFKTIGPAEVFTTDGIEYRRPFYRIVNNGRHIDQAQSEAVNRAVRDLFPRPDPTPVFITPDAPYDETVLIVSDSYGYNAAPEFASAFKRLVHISTYGMDQSKLPELFARVEKMVPFSRVIMLVMEGNTEQLLAWSRALGAQTQ